MLFVFAINEQRIKPKQKKVMKKFIALLALVLVSASTMTVSYTHLTLPTIYSV